MCNKDSIKAVLHITICMIRFVWLLFSFSMMRIIWTCKLRNRSNFLSDTIFKQETQRVVTIAMFCSTLALLWKFQYFWRPIYNPVELLWWSFYYENSKPSVFTKKLNRRWLLGFLKGFFFLKTLQKYFFFKVFGIIRLLRSVICLKYFFSFNSSNMLSNT